MVTRGWALLALLTTGCLTDRLGTPEGYRCDVPADCPAPYQCIGRVCRGDGGTPPPLEKAVVVAAGGIACDPADQDFNQGNGTSQLCRMKDTASLAREQNPDAVLSLGDLQRESGSTQAFQSSFALHWGTSPLREKLRPVPGRAEYRTPGAAGYVATFGDAGSTSFDLGPWHVVTLNAFDSNALAWLQADLAAHRSPCTLATLGDAPFSSGEAPLPTTRALWAVLADAGVDVVLGNGGPHFERFAAMNANGERDDAGTRLFLVGTGGARLGSAAQTAPNSERTAASHGVLRLELGDGGYAWRFIAVPDVPLDERGEGRCR